MKLEELECVKDTVDLDEYIKIREEVKRLAPSNVEVVIPPMWATTDNAAIIAKAAVAYMKKGLYSPLNIGVDPTWELSDCQNNK